MIRRCPANALCLFFCLLAFSFPTSAQEPKSEIPIERCDVLPIVKVAIDGTEMHFLLDTAATTVLNLKSFSAGRSREIRISSWTGTAATSAREVSLPELVFGEHKLLNLKLPAIDLSPIGNACGGKIDGILGVDLLDKMGVTIDLKRRIATFAPAPADARKIYDQMESSMHKCNVAFTEGNSAVLEDCFDPDIVLYTPHGEFRGREQVMKYLEDRYLKFAPKLSYEMSLREVKMFGDALWYSYDYTIDSPREHAAGHGMSMCRKDGDRWRILNLHNSLRDPSAVAKVEAPVEP
jgi:ketosteroid isomerase-like protein